MRSPEEYIAAALLIMMPMRALINKRFEEAGRTPEEDATLDRLRQDILQLWQEAREDGHSAEDLSWRAGLALRAPKVAP